MALIRQFEDIKAWQMARQLTRQVYELSDAGAFSYDQALSVKRLIGGLCHSVLKRLNT